jgi:hypothetical protein
MNSNVLLSFSISNDEKYNNEFDNIIDNKNSNKYIKKSIKNDLNNNYFNDNIDSETIKLRNKKLNNIFDIENNNFNILASNNNDNKVKLLKKIVNKNNRKMTDELNDKIQSYNDKKTQIYQLEKISKKKLPLKIMKIFKNHKKNIFDVIYNCNPVSESSENNEMTQNEEDNSSENIF